MMVCCLVPAKAGSTSILICDMTIEHIMRGHPRQLGLPLLLLNKMVLNALGKSNLDSSS